MNQESKQPEVKVYAYDTGITEWVAAVDEPSAKKCLLDMIDVEEEDMEKEGVELDDAAMEKLIFKDENGFKRSFKEELAIRLANGEVAPFTFASSEC